jgi:pyridoxal phosphate-dependent aminotransferase EpsN
MTAQPQSTKPELIGEDSLRTPAAHPPARWRIFLSPPELSGDERALIQQALDSNWIAPLGPMVDAFEQAFAAKIGAAHALALSSGTAALHLGLEGLGVGHGGEVYVSTLTFVATIAPAVQLGATPVFIDADPLTWTMDLNRLEEALRRASRAGRRMMAVIPVDLYGQPADLDAIVSISQHYGVPVLADSAEALGARYKDRSTGMAAVAAAAFSFNGNKIITTSGGGMLASDDGERIKRARFLSQQARDPAPHYQHSQLGYNYRLSNILAAIGLGQLAHLDARVTRRREIFAQYQSLLADCPGLSFMPEASYGASSRWLTVITIDPKDFGSDRNAVQLALAIKGIESRPVWKPMHMQPVFKEADCFGGEVSRTIFEQGLCLPSGGKLTAADIEEIASIVRSAGRG